MATVAQLIPITMLLSQTLRDAGLTPSPIIVLPRLDWLKLASDVARREHNEGSVDLDEQSMFRIGDVVFVKGEDRPTPTKEHGDE